MSDGRQRHDALRALTVELFDPEPEQIEQRCRPTRSPTSDTPTDSQYVRWEGS
jgi:hypothetical protein